MLNNKGIMRSVKSKRNATSCSIARKYLEKRAPKDWKLFCEENNLAVELSIELNKNLKLEKPQKVLAANYREMANNLVFIAKNSPLDILEKVMVIRLKQESDDFLINAVTEGKYIVKLATLKSHELIKEHLKNTVQVQELPIR